MTKEEKTERARERLIRWEKNQRDMLTNLLNIVFGLATGLLAFIANSVPQPIDFSGPWWMFLLLGLSILAAGVAYLSRFHDFRKTAEITRLKYYQIKDGKDNKVLIEEHRKESSRLGTLTYTCVFMQILAFVLAVIIFCYTRL
jgi:hypothetical protein